MRKLLILSTAAMILLATALAWAATTFTGPNISVSTITFTANNPGANGTTNPISGSSTASATFSITATSHGMWSLSVTAGGSTFSGCPTVPASAGSIACTSATVSPIGNGANASCNSLNTFLPLSTTPTTLANGQEPNNGSTKNYTIVLSYQFGDSWRYIPKTCPLTLTYTLNTQ